MDAQLNGPFDVAQDKLKQWKCKHGHVLGVVERYKFKNRAGKTREISRLLLYRHAIDLEQSTPQEVDVIGPVEGTAGPFRCDVEGCGESRVWELGADALERFMTKLSTDLKADKRMNMNLMEKIVEAAHEQR